MQFWRHSFGILRARIAAGQIDGGVQMKIWKLLLAVSLVATWGLMSAAGAKADALPPDPHFVVNNQCAPGSTAPGCDQLFIAVSDPSATAGTISESFETFVNITQNYEAPTTDENNLTSLVVTITGVTPGAAWQCFSNIFEECTAAQEGSGAGTEEVLSFDDLDPAGDITSGTNAGEYVCENNGVAQGVCPGFIAPGEVVSTAIITPEPSSILLLVVALVPVLGLGRKRWMGAR
jgi:hypothetical protein